MAAHPSLRNGFLGHRMEMDVSARKMMPKREAPAHLSLPRRPHRNSSFFRQMHGLVFQSTLQKRLGLLNCALVIGNIAISHVVTPISGKGWASHTGAIPLSQFSLVLCSGQTPEAQGSPRKRFSTYSSPSSNVRSGTFEGCHIQRTSSARSGFP